MLRNVTVHFHQGSFHSQPREVTPWIHPWEELKMVSLLRWVFNHWFGDPWRRVCGSLQIEGMLAWPENFCTSLAINLWTFSSHRHNSDAIHGFIFPESEKEPSFDELKLALVIILPTSHPLSLLLYVLIYGVGSQEQIKQNSQFLRDILLKNQPLPVT